MEPLAPLLFKLVTDKDNTIWQPTDFSLMCGRPLKPKDPTVTVTPQTPQTGPSKAKTGGKPRTRSANMSPDERVVLLNLWKQNPILTDPRTDRQTSTQKEAAWDSITAQFKVYTIEHKYRTRDKTFLKTALCNMQRKWRRLKKSPGELYGVDVADPLDFCATDYDGSEHSSSTIDNMDADVPVKVEMDDDWNESSHDDWNEDSSAVHDVQNDESLNGHDRRKRFREANYTTDERLLLIELINQRPILFSTEYAPEKRERTWIELASVFNETNKRRMPSHIDRSVKSLQNLWCNLKRLKRGKDAKANKPGTKNNLNPFLSNWDPTNDSISEPEDESSPPALPASAPLLPLPPTLPIASAEPSTAKFTLSEFDESCLLKFNSEDAKALIRQRTAQEKTLFELKERKERLKIQLLEMEINQRRKMWTDST